MLSKTNLFALVGSRQWINGSDLLANKVRVGDQRSVVAISQHVSDHSKDNPYLLHTLLVKVAGVRVDLLHSPV